jgi:tRNA A-37 threonylcarbamoyl transferase component Bud32
VKETWRWEEGGEAVLAPRGLAAIDAIVAAAATGRVLSSDRQSAAVLLPGEPPLLVKWRHTLPARRWRTFLRASRERKEADAARRARGLGIPAHMTLAVGERRSAGFLVASVLVRRFVPDAVPLSERPDEAPRAARELRRWHDLGFRHGDAWPKNLLLPAGEGEPFPVGFPLARFVRPGARLDRARRRDLARLAAGLSLLERAPFSFLAAYLEAPGLPGPVEVERAVTPIVEEVLDRKRRRRVAEASRPIHGPLPLPPFNPPRR